MEAKKFCENSEVFAMVVRWYLPGKDLISQPITD
jgi:hypothetical protein